MKVGRELWDDVEARDRYVDSILWSQDIFREKFYHLTYDELPEYIKFGLETHPQRGVVIKTLTIQERVWSSGDTYLVCPETQVMEDFKKGDKVKVTIEKILVEEEQS